jgi:hypothetical protein
MSGSAESRDHPPFRVLLLRVLGVELVVWVSLWLLQSRYSG